jgi:4-methyl-5(b-hydroxyethyl)-thiazole monophosphate biosynthesis
MVKVLVPIANGSEEIETCGITDTLVRAGAEVVVASVEEGLECKMSRGVKMVADASIADVAATEFDCIAVPGGMPGAKTIGECVPFVTMLKAHVAAGKPYGAICAAPAVVLLPNSLIPEGAPATCHPGFAAKLAEGGVTGGCSEERVVVHGKLVTSRGPGTAIEFALALITQLFGAEKASEVAGPMLVKM